MSATGLDVFDKTLQTTNIWLDEIMVELGPDRQLAWKVLSTVLHKLRDRLPVDAAAHLGAQLPLLVRGVYYDQYRPAHQPSDWRTIDQFHAEIAKWLSDVRPVDPKAATRAVFGVLLRHVDPGQVAKVLRILPASIRDHWLSLQAECEAAAEQASAIKTPELET
jgi:uncharacterized protein (DUF2267 family)